MPKRGLWTWKIECYLLIPLSRHTKASVKKNWGCPGGGAWRKVASSPTNAISRQDRLPLISHYLDNASSQILWSLVTTNWVPPEEGGGVH